MNPTSHFEFWKQAVESLAFSGRTERKRLIGGEFHLCCFVKNNTKNKHRLSRKAKKV